MTFCERKVAITAKPEVVKKWSHSTNHSTRMLKYQIKLVRVNRTFPSPDCIVLK